METANQQRNLFEIEPPRRPRPAPLAAKADPVTSHVAAAAIMTSGHERSQKAVILAFLRTQTRALTSREIAHQSGIDRYDVARRMAGLVRDGDVVRSGARTCSLGLTSAITWLAADASSAITATSSAKVRPDVGLECRCGHTFTVSAAEARANSGSHCPACRRWVEVRV